MQTRMLRHLRNAAPLLCALTLACVAAPATAAGTADGPGFSISGGEIEIGSVPEEVRTVPVVIKGDAIEVRPYPIAGGRYLVEPVVSLSAPFRRNRNGSAVFTLGLQWILYPQPFLPISEEPRHLDFENAGIPDSYFSGRVSTFYAISPRGIIPAFSNDPRANAFLNFTPYIQAEFPRKSPLRLKASLSFFRVEAVTGWFRRDSACDYASVWFDGDNGITEEDYPIRIYKSYTLAYCFPVVAGMKYRGVTVGARYLLIARTALGEKSRIQAPRRSLFLAFDF